MMNLNELVQSLVREDGTLSAEQLLLAAEQLPDAEAERSVWEAEKREFLLKEVFWKAGAREADYLAYHYRKEAIFGEDGSLVNGEELVAKAKEELPEFFPKRSVRLNGVRPQEGKSTLLSKESLAGMSYAERADLLARDPGLYHKLRGF